MYLRAITSIWVLIVKNWFCWNKIHWSYLYYMTEVKKTLGNFSLKSIIKQFVLHMYNYVEKTTDVIDQQRAGKSPERQNKKLPEDNCHLDSNWSTIVRWQSYFRWKSHQEIREKGGYPTLHMAYGTKRSYNLYFRQIATFYHLPSMESTKSFKKQSVLFNSRANIFKSGDSGNCHFMN